MGRDRVRFHDGCLGFARANPGSFDILGLRDATGEAMSDLNLISAFAALNCFFIAILMALTKRSLPAANRILALLIGLEGLRLTACTFLDPNNPRGLGILVYALFLRLTVGPLLWLYVKALVQQTFRFSLSLLLHFAPFAIACIVAWQPFWPVSNPVSEKGWEGILTQLASVAIQVSIGTYAFVSARYLKKHAGHVRQEFSNIDSVNLDWLYKLCLFFMGMIVVFFFLFLFQRELGIEREEFVWIGTTSGLIVSYVLAVCALGQARIFYSGDFPVPGVREDVASADPHLARYQTSKLSADDVERSYRRLLEHMTEARPYLNPNLRIEHLAKALRLNARYMSQTINQCSGRTFYEFVSHYRVEEAKKIIEAAGDERMPTVSLAEEVGFNSISTFYKHFKSETGVTPTEYASSLARSARSADTDS